MYSFTGDIGQVKMPDWNRNPNCGLLVRKLEHQTLLTIGHLTETTLIITSEGY